MSILSNQYTLIISILTLGGLCFLGYLFLFRQQDSKLNWALFYSALYVGTTLPIINYLCIKLQLWSFSEAVSNSIKLPFELYFLWLLLWSVIPVFYFKAKYIWVLALVLFWLDISTMPLLEEMGILFLEKNWWLGEVILICIVFLPSYFWAYCSYYKKHTGLRAVFQVFIMACLFLICLPFIMESYGLIKSSTVDFAPYTFQLFLILVFPSLVAVIDLVKKGRGTPFPYDPTLHLVRTGVYAYIRNPIQWSFTFMFIPLSIYYSSYFLLIGVIVSIAYSFGISDHQEYKDMQERFGEGWNQYKKNVPKWRFLWTPKSIPRGEIFFDANCIQCSQISRWFSDSKAINLDIKASDEFPKDSILQATYVDHNGIEYKSVSAIACSLEHINLAYASLAWFMRFPIINHVLQLIVDSMGFGASKKES